jgi:hypothetical protein
MVRAATMSRRMAERALGREQDLPEGSAPVPGAPRVRTVLRHSHIYQLISLLGFDYEEVRAQLREAAYAMRHNKFAVRFIGDFADRTTINPVMAVETERLTKEEHERELKRANDRRVRECIRLLGRIGLDFVRNPDHYEFRQIEDSAGYMREFVYHRLESLRDEEAYAALVEEQIEALEKADRARSDGGILTVD